MNEAYRRALRRLAGVGWKVETSEAGLDLPETLTTRYPWLPEAHRDFLGEARLVCRADDKAWLLTAADYRGTSGAAYAWNEWETLSQSAAAADEGWRHSVEAFWRVHCPIVLSVTSGYAYFALEQDGLAVVRGEEPEFEETTRVAASVPELLELFASGDPRVTRWA